MKASNLSNDLSNDALDFELLPEPLQTMLAQAVDEYVVAMEEGCEPIRDDFLKRYEPIQEQLNAYLDQIDWLHDESKWNHVAQTTLNSQAATGLDYEDFELDAELGRGQWGSFIELIKSPCNVG